MINKKNELWQLFKFFIDDDRQRSVWNRRERAVDRSHLRGRVIVAAISCDPTTDLSVPITSGKIGCLPISLRVRWVSDDRRSVRPIRFGLCVLWRRIERWLTRAIVIRWWFFLSYFFLADLWSRAIQRRTYPFALSELLPLYLLFSFDLFVRLILCGHRNLPSFTFEDFTSGTLFIDRFYLFCRAGEATMIYSG